MTSNIKFNSLSVKVMIQCGISHALFLKIKIDKQQTLKN